MDRSEGKAKRKRFTGWHSQEKRESYLVNIMISLAFLILALLVVLIASVMGRTERLQFENMIERSFNDVVFDLQQNSYSGYSPSFTEDVVGVGLYDASGSLIQGWGSVYNMLPVSSIASRSTEGGSNTLISYNPSTDVLEYIRFLRQPLALNSISFLTGGPAFSDDSLIMYMAFDGSHYMDRQKAIYFIAFLVLIGIILLFLFVMKLMQQNRDYKDQMAKQGNLVNLGQAARTLTHEIKNPLSAITIQIALLKRQLRDSEYLDEVALIENECQRLINLTNRVSDFLRNPEGQPEQIDVAAMINSLIPLFAYPIKVLESSEKQAYILFDPDRLRSVVENILKNAVESCSGRDPQVEVEVVLGRRGMYHIYVRDRGDGIQGDVEKLFDPFYTTKIHGSGIGLSISRQFLRARGGDIRIYSRSGGGTVVELIVARYSYVQELVVSGAGNSKGRRGRN